MENQPYIGEEVKANNQKNVFYRSSQRAEEQQPAEYFDPDLLSKDGESLDTLPHFLKTILDSNLKSYVIPIVSSSKEASEDMDLYFDMVLLMVATAKKMLKQTLIYGQKGCQKGY